MSEQLEQELAESGLRLATADEAGWYYTSEFGKVWVTDYTFPNVDPDPLCVPAINNGDYDVTAYEVQFV